MSVTIPQVQQGSQGGQSQSITAVGITETVGFGVFSALYRYQLGTGAMISYPLTFTASQTGATPTSVFYLAMLTDPDLVSSIVNNAVLPLDHIPDLITNVVNGTGPSVALASVTIVGDGSYSFDIDLATLTQFMSTSTYYTGGWNGSLLLWLFTDDNAITLWSNPTLTAGNYANYANRLTGRSGAPAGSRVDRCPVTGLSVSRANMVRDGYRNIYVHPLAWDPAEPEDPVFNDYPDPNED